MLLMLLLQKSSLQNVVHHLASYNPYHHQQYTGSSTSNQAPNNPEEVRERRGKGYRVPSKPHTKPPTLKLKNPRRDLGTLLDLCTMLEPQRVARHPCAGAMLQWSWQACHPCVRGHASLVLTGALVHFSICANRLCKHTPPHASVSE